jgi:hypothetical protein
MKLIITFQNETKEIICESCSFLNGFLAIKFKDNNPKELLINQTKILMIETYQEDKV